MKNCDICDKCQSEILLSPAEYGSRSPDLWICGGCGREFDLDYIFGRDDRFGQGLEYLLYADKNSTFSIATDLRERGCPECDPSIKVEGGYYIMCEKHHEEWVGL